MTAEEIKAASFTDEFKKNIEFKRGGVSTVLVPAELLKDFKIKCKRYKGKAEYFSFLMKRFGIVLKCYARNPEGLKTLFQKKNQNLQKVNFRPLDEDWAELGTFSIASGRSRCLLFVILLIFDSGNLASVLRDAGLVINLPPDAGKRWELLSIFGVDRGEGHSVRGFLIKLLDKPGAENSEKEEII